MMSHKSAILKRVLQLSLFSSLCLLNGPLSADIPHPEGHKENTYTINFHDVPVVEFIQFVSKISDVNFIFNHRDLHFNVTLSSGKPATPDQVVRALVQVLRAHGMSIAHEDGYFVIHKGGEEAPSLRGYDSRHSEAGVPTGAAGTEGLLTSLHPLYGETLPFSGESKPNFLVYKLQYHDGSEIEETVKRIAGDLATKPGTSPSYLDVLKSVQWIKATNSLVCSGDEESLKNVKELLKDLDAPLRQVFIEVLVVETDARNSSDFGLQWAAGGRIKDGLGFGLGNFAPSNPPGPFAQSFQGVNGGHPPTGPSQIPLGNGFDMGVIGDVLFHKGKSFLSLASLVSALQVDGDSSIVLNQKIITQDNKNSKIFVGDNIPFTGSIVQTNGSSQQTTANVEYRDIGVNLSITPKLGEGDIITLDLSEEITEAIPTGAQGVSSSNVSGIQTTKTNMMTHVHVPDRHFLVLSGMIRNAKSRHKAGLPCLGGLPWIGALFSKTEKHDEKRNVIIFVRPHIIKSVDDYRRVTQNQEDLYKKLSSPEVIEQATSLVK
jgi:type III secretion protein C